MTEASNTRPKQNSNIATDAASKTAWVVVLVVLLVAAAVPIGIEAQYLFSYLLLLPVLVCKKLSRDPPHDWAGSTAILFGCFLSIRYIFWRGGYTLTGLDIVSTLAAICLFLAEVYSLFIHLTGALINFSPLRRGERHLDENTDPPSVDILIPSYNEDPSLLEITIRACNLIRYPDLQKKVYLLDDGGTEQKCNDPDPDRATEARNRRATLKTLCERLGAHYLAREKNEFAKAGNINAALPNTSGELVLILDADHVPTVDFLELTAPWFQQHSDVFLVQTPHFTINPDPVDRNLLNLFRRMPTEQDMFYMTVQRGLDFWESSFFCGSAALLRRSHLDQAGGLAGDSITEDAETALEIHSKGLYSVYIDRPMIAGLAPETLAGLVTQRLRWTQGMIQILLLKNPLKKKGLRWFQKLGYITSSSFWFFPLARLTFLLAPTTYLVFDINIYNASAAEIFGYTVPHLIATVAIASILFGRHRWPLISELYETMLSLFLVRAIVQVFLNPRRPQFSVTPKGETLDQDFVSPLAAPLYWLILFLAIGLGIGVAKSWGHLEAFSLTAMVIFWQVFNLVLVVASLGALLERRQRRSDPRMPVSKPCVIVESETGSETGPSDDRECAKRTSIPCRIIDLSARGAQIEFEDTSIELNVGDERDLEVDIPALSRSGRIRLNIKTIFEHHGRTMAGLQFAPKDENQRNDAVALMYGDSEAWAKFQSRRSRPMSFFSALQLVVKLSYRPVVEHARLLANRLN